mgnify:FL=1|tara:strand:- start:115 stop:300 length:186 start_codon:yes stop_codon:yes gene_type:complete
MTSHTVTNSEFVTQAYRDLLKREPDTEGLDYWIADIEERGQTRDNVISNIKLSEEYKNLKK